jgi:hypothetical protein
MGLANWNLRYPERASKMLGDPGGIDLLRGHEAIAFHRLRSDPIPSNGYFRRTVKSCRIGETMATERVLGRLCFLKSSQGLFRT